MTGDSGNNLAENNTLALSFCHQNGQYKIHLQNSSVNIAQFFFSNEMA